ncbi:MAG: 3-oxoacyl-ACP synthase, partial [Ignavibacteriaceae bacterium]|nr:3-oxoacyl-ACP synthase [Ignavibacteriaceae bacterium]
MENNKKCNAAITALGMYVPEKILDNAYFEKIVDTSDEWIRTRTGIQERRMLENGATSDLATGAAKDLLATYKINPEELEVIIVATVTPDMFFP